MSPTTKDVNNCMNREARSGAAFGDLASATDAYGRKPTSATVTNAFPVVNIGDADLALGDAWRRVRQRRSRPRFFGHGCKISATIVS